MTSVYVKRAVNSGLSSHALENISMWLLHLLLFITRKYTIINANLKRKKNIFSN